MGSGKDEVLLRVYEYFLADCKIAPEQKYEAILMVGKIFNGSIGKSFPSFFLVRPRLMCPYCEGCVEQ